MRAAETILLSQWTTLKLGGAAKSLTRVESEAELDAFVRSEPGCLILGGGSNLVVADDGVSEPVLQLGFQSIEVSRTSDRATVLVGAGIAWDELARRAVEEEWAGIESLSGIPGSVGATPMQNVGAYGHEVSETITRVRAYDRETNAFSWIANAECAFRYRSSRFRGSRRFILVGVEFDFKRSGGSAPVRYAELAKALRLREGEGAPLGVVRETVIALRRGKGMVVDPNDLDSVSAGSFFTNPLLTEDQLRALKVKAPNAPVFPGEDGRTKVSAGWLIENAGFKKGYALGRAHLSSKHALALVNGGGTTADLLALARTVRDGVKQAFGIILEPEPIFWGCSL